MKGNRLTDEEARACGLGHLLPKRKAGRPGLNEFGQNKLEARFARRLDDDKHRGVIKECYFESVKFRLAKATFFTPDFYVVMPDGSVRVYETKGGWFRDDARVKIKVAAEMYPHIRWVVARWINGEWVYETISGRGTS